MFCAKQKLYQACWQRRKTKQASSKFPFPLAAVISSVVHGDPVVGWGNTQYRQIGSAALKMRVKII